jgi:hypothetical protein
LLGACSLLILYLVKKPIETHEDKKGSNHHQKHMSFKIQERKTCKEIQEDYDEHHEKNHNCLRMDREM